MMEGDQLGFDALLEDAQSANTQRIFDRETAHLPDTWEEALACHRDQISEHHAAMLDADFDTAMAIRKEAHLLAKKLNGGNPGILASEDAPGCKLDTHSAAPEGDTPLWGQSDTFVINAAGMAAQVDMNGMFGIGATAMPYLGFSLRAMDESILFLSETGYRSFLGCSVPAEPGMNTEGFVLRVIETYVAKELGGRLVEIDPKWTD